MATARVQLDCVLSDDRLAPECRLFKADKQGQLALPASAAFRDMFSIHLRIASRVFLNLWRRCCDL